MTKKYVLQLEMEINNRNITTLDDLNKNDNKEAIYKILDKMFKSKKICEEEFSRLPQKDILLAIVDNYVYDEKNKIEIMDYELKINAPTNTISSVEAYLREIGKYPLLSKEEEKELSFITKNGTKEEKAKAKRKLIESNLRLVVNIAKSYFSSSTPANEFLDMVQNGNFGLMKAIDKYDPTLDYKLSTYATWWIRQAIQRGNDDSYSIKIPSHMLEKLRRIKKVTKELTNSLGRIPTKEEIVDEYNKKININTENNFLTVETLEKMYDDTRSVGSLDIPLGEDSDDLLIDFVEDKTTNVENQAVDSVSNDALCELIKNVLSERENDVILRRFGFNGRKVETLEEIAKDYHCTRERIRQIEEKALKKIRARLTREATLRDIKKLQKK